VTAVEPEPPTSARSGACLYPTHPRLHAVCSGTFSYRDGPHSSPEDRCSCLCHTRDGAHLLPAKVAAARWPS
jgi:hypothetical protein